MMILRWCLFISLIFLSCGLLKSLTDRGVCHLELSKERVSTHINAETDQLTYQIGNFAAEEYEDENHNEFILIAVSTIRNHVSNDSWVKKEIRGYHNTTFILFEADNSPPTT